jgi:hypothetical protein
VPPKPAERDGALDTGAQLRTRRFETTLPLGVCDAATNCLAILHQ